MLTEHNNNHKRKRTFANLDEIDLTRRRSKVLLDNYLHVIPRINYLAVWPY